MSTNYSDRLNGVLSTLAVKAPCVTVSNTNILLEGEQEIGGVAVVTGDRVLVNGQSDRTENGVYDVNTSAWSRSRDFDGNRDSVKGTIVSVNAGDEVGRAFYTLVSSNPIIPGASEIVFENTSSVSFDLFSKIKATEDATFYVDPAGDDNNDGGSLASPFQTLNKAIRSVANLIEYGVSVSIILSDGVHKLSSIDSADMPRPAVGYVTGVFGSDRSADSSSGLIGPLVISGTSKLGTIIETSDDFIYGIYCTSMPTIAIQNFTIRGVASNTQGLLVAHRHAYVQAKDVILDGGGVASACAIAESGGVLEISGDCEIKNAAVGVQAFFNSTIVVSRNTVISGTTTSALSGAGSISLNNFVEVLSDSSFSQLKLTFRGFAADQPVKMKGRITAFNSEIVATYVEFSDLVDLTDCDLQMNFSRWSDQIIMRSGSIHLRSVTKSYIDPATTSTVNNPLALLGDAQYYTNALAEIAGLSGRSSPSRNPRQQNISANAAEIDYQSQGGRLVVTELTATSGAFTGCTLPLLSSDFSQPPVIGDFWSVVFTGAVNSVELVDSTTAQFVNGAVILGVAVGEYQAVNFMFSPTGKWIEVSRSTTVT